MSFSFNFSEQLNVDDFVQKSRVYSELSDARRFRVLFELIFPRKLLKPYYVRVAQSSPVRERRAPSCPEIPEILKLS